VTQSTIRERALEIKTDTKTELTPSEISALWSDLTRGLKRSYFQRESDRIQKALVAADEAKDGITARQLLMEKQDLMKVFNAQR
jgi:hypothetical protein